MLLRLTKDAARNLKKAAEGRDFLALWNGVTVLRAAGLLCE